LPDRQVSELLDAHRCFLSLSFVTLNRRGGNKTP
jgi:hypothetical protein